MRMAGRPHGSLLMLHERQTKCVKMRPKTFHHLFHPSLAAYFLFCGVQLQYGLLTSFEGEFARGRLSRFVLRATSVNFHKAVRNFTHAQPSRVGPKRNSVGDCHGVQEMIVQKTTFMLPDFLTFWLSSHLRFYRGPRSGPGFAVWLLTCEHLQRRQPFRHRKLVDYNSELNCEVPTCQTNFVRSQLWGWPLCQRQVWSSATETTAESQASFANDKIYGLPIIAQSLKALKQTGRYLYTHLMHCSYMYGRGSQLVSASHSLSSGPVTH